MKRKIAIALSAAMLATSVMGSGTIAWAEEFSGGGYTETITPEDSEEENILEDFGEEIVIEEVFTDDECNDSLEVITEEEEESPESEETVAQENAETGSEEIPLFDDGISTYGMARGGGESYEDDDKDISSAMPVFSFDEDGYYPASLEYVLNNFTIRITYEDGTTEQVQYWSPVTYDSDYAQIGDYVCYTPYGMCYMHFYDEDGNRVKITDSYVPLGKYEVEICDDNGETLIDDLELKIIDPETGTNSGNTASFSSSQYNKYEEIWFPVPSELTGNYIYNYSYDSSNWYFSNYFAGLWSLADGVAQRVNEGIKDYSTDDSFEQVLDGENENLYLVIGECYSSYAISGSMTWQQEKEVSSIEVKTASSYTAWNGDIEENSSLIVSYTDETTETLSNWSSSYYWDSEISADVYKVVSKNNDSFYIGRTDSDGMLTDCYSEDSWKSGTTTWKAWMADDANINTTFSLTITEPDSKEIELEEGKQKNFNISEDNEAYYRFSVSDEAKKAELTNDSANEMYCNVYKKNSSTECWDSVQGSYISKSSMKTFDLDEGYEYLVILYTYKSNEGTFGLYTEGTATSASADPLTVKSNDLMTWVTLPATISFVGTDGETVVGTQVIKSWNRYDKQSGYAKTKYNETIWYALYKDGTRVDFPIFSESILTEMGYLQGQELSGDQLEEMKKMIAEMYGYDADDIVWSMTPGTYTIKFFKDSIADTNEIGSAKVTVISDQCTNHKWDSGKVTKAATCTTTGVKTYTCTNSGCGETKTETIAVTSHSYGSWTTKTQATALAAAVQTRTCSVCKKTETRNYGSKLAAKAELPGGLKSVTIKKGKTVKFTLSMTTGDSIVSCTSSNSKILKVSAVNKTTGAITLKAVKSGSANLVIKLKSNTSKSYTYKVKVSTGTVKTTKITGVASKKTLAKKGATFSVKPTLVPFTSTQSVTYSSSNKKVATVTSAGKVKAVAPGTAKITVKSGSKKAVCTVTVKGIGNIKTSLSLAKKKTTTLKPKLYGISGTVTYTSSNPKVATVNAKGKITALKKGTTTITVKVGSYSCKCKVTVK